MVEERILPVKEETEENLVGLPEDEELVGKSAGEEEEGEDLSDMFEVPQQGYEKENVSDIFEVSEEDIMGEDEEEEGIEDLFEVGEEPHWSDEDIKDYEQAQKSPKPKKILYRRTSKRYPTMPQIGGTE